MAAKLHYGNIGLGSCFPSSVLPPSPAVNSVFAVDRLLVHPCTLGNDCVYLRNLFLVTKLDEALFSFDKIVPLKFHQNLTSGFRFSMAQIGEGNCYFHKEDSDINTKKLYTALLII